MLLCSLIHVYSLDGGQRTKGTNASPIEGTNQPHLSKRQIIGIRTQWKELYTKCRREREKHYSPSENEKKAEEKVKPPAGAI